jgi:hypothetical protein
VQRRARGSGRFRHARCLDPAAGDQRKQQGGLHPPSARARRRCLFPGRARPHRVSAHHARLFAVTRAVRPAFL